MDVVAALTVAAAMLCTGLAFAPSSPNDRVDRGSWFTRLVRRSTVQLREARLHIDARRFTLACIASPPALLLLGILMGSPVLAAAGCAAGLLAPRLYLNILVRAQQRRSEAEAPRFLQVLVSSLTAGRTYLETLEEARRRAQDRWLRDDLDHVLRQFHLDVPLEDSIAEVRAACGGRNLGLIWDNLAICIGNRIPASRAKSVFVELASTVHFNVQLQTEVRAKTSGQRVQIWLLAAIVPGLYFYLRLINPDFFTVFDGTFLGRFALMPAAVVLEVLGIVLSLRISEVDGL